MQEAELSEEDFLDSLPSDQEDAFPKYEAWIRANCIEDDTSGSGDMRSDYNRYFSELLVYCQEHNMDIGYTFDDIEINTSGNKDYYLESKVTAFRRIMTLRSSTKRKSNINPSYVLTPALRTKIHHHIEQIKEKLNALDLTELKRNELFKKLNAFSASIDQDKTRLETFGSLLVSIEKDATPCYKKAMDMLGLFKNATIYAPHLIEKENRKLLEAPTKKIEDKSQSNDNTDKIPF